MYLKRLELLGFKSFPEKTIIKLTPGVTSVVGPNGCGKTNILDSIRWVLGEQKVSLLRGSKMEEVIFNGTHDVKPLGMAEVTLVVQNNKGKLPTEYGEVQVTRRLFRSGESEYLLNRVPCRLKDITDLFMDTGVGAHVYSVIQQDMIEAILSDRADDRRFLFEEAAGISKYKNRKKAALRKLEATEADLLRLKDIVSEVNTQVNSLKRQMNKARRYKELSDELKDWELYLSKDSVNKLSQEKRELASRKDSLQDTKTRHDSEIDNFSADQEADRKKLADLDRKLTEISAEIYDKTEAAHSLEKEITVLRERRENAANLKQKNRLDIEAYHKRKELLGQEIEKTEAELSKLREELSQMESVITEAESELSAADDKVLSARKSREELNKKLIDIESRLSAGKSDDSNLKEQENEFTSSLATVARRISEFSAERTSLMEKRTGMENEFLVLRNRLNETTGRKNALENDLSNLDDEIDRLADRISELNASIEAAEARRQVLTDMVAQYEGYSSGVVETMENREQWPGLIGTLAERIEAHSGYEEALEAAFGEAAGYMVCRERRTADQIIDYLKAEKKGKAGFLILENVPEVDTSSRPNIESGGFIGWADDLIDTDDEIRPLARLLLSYTAVIRGDYAADIISELPRPYSAVTMDGRVYHGKSVMTGGSKEGLSLLGRKEKIAEQEKVIEELRSEIEKLKNDRNRKTSEFGTRQAELAELKDTIESLQEDKSVNEKELSQIRYNVQTVENDMARKERERKELQSKLEVLHNRQYTLNLSHDQLEKEKENILEIFEIKDNEIEELEKESSDKEQQFSSLQINLVENKSRIQQLESQIQHTRELIKEIESNITIKTEEIERADLETTESGERIIQLEKELKETFDERSEISSRKTGISEEHGELQTKIDENEQEIKTLRRAREEASTQLHQAEIRMAETESEIKNIKQNIADEYDVDLDEIEAAIPDREIDPQQRHERMREIKERLKDFGAVNLLALEEYETSQERQSFLNTQMEDLINAKATLQSTISKINLTARKLFLDTIEKVRDNFRQVFEELFTGGEADLRLVNPDDPLESPIEIIARPRGKKLISIAQMSGGERALTAISLLFSIYLVKPSPFCILDEIDAPLDDANIHRFLKIIRTFSEQTQFIIITHNKITMEAADNLYGITMEQPGVSRVVSVRFSDDTDKVIDTSMEERENVEMELPDSIKERLNPPVHIRDHDNAEEE